MAQNRWKYRECSPNACCRGKFEESEILGSTVGSVAVQNGGWTWRRGQVDCTDSFHVKGGCTARPVSNTAEVPLVQSDGLAAAIPLVQKKVGVPPVLHQGPRRIPGSTRQDAWLTKWRGKSPGPGFVWVCLCLSCVVSGCVALALGAWVWWSWPSLRRLPGLGRFPHFYLKRATTQEPIPLARPWYALVVGLVFYRISYSFNLLCASLPSGSSAQRSSESRKTVEVQQRSR